MGDLTVETAAGPAHVELTRPRPPLHALLVLTHGAGGGVRTADLLAVRDAATQAGIAVALLTQPYRVAGRRTPPAPGPQDEAFVEAVAAVRRSRGLARVPLLVGGRSNGARVGCRTALATGAAGVLALAFPLHPPGRPDRSRLPELVGAGAPVLVVQGDRDPFGMPPAGDRHIVVEVAGADHTLKKDPAAVAAAVLSFTTALVQARR